LKNEKFETAFFALISPNLGFFGINMPFAVHWNPLGAKKNENFPVIEQTFK